MSQNRVIVGALSISVCFPFSSCLNRTWNSAGAHVALHKLKSGVVWINSWGPSKKMYARSETGSPARMSHCKCLSQSLKRKESSIFLTYADLHKNSLTFPWSFQAYQVPWEFPVFSVGRHSDYIRSTSKIGTTCETSSCAAIFLKVWHNWTGKHNYRQF